MLEVREREALLGRVGRLTFLGCLLGERPIELDETELELMTRDKSVCLKALRNDDALFWELVITLV